MSASLGEAVFSLQVETSDYASALDEAQKTTESHAGAIASSLDTVGESFHHITEMALGFAEAQIALSGLRDITEALKESVISWNSTLQQSGISWGVFLNGASQANTMMYALQQFTNKTQYQMPQINQLAQQLQNAGVQGNNLVAILGDVVTASDASGRGAAGLQEIGYAIAEVNRQGVLMERQIRMLGNDGVQVNKIIQQMADDTGTSFSQVQENIHKGTVSADEFMGAFDKVMRTNYGDLIYQQSQTFSGAMSTIKDQARLLGSEAFQPLFTLISEFAVKIADDMSVSGSAFQKFGEKVNVIMAAAATAIRALLPVVAGIFGAIGGVLGSFIGGVTDVFQQFNNVFSSIDNQIQGTDDIAKKMFDTTYQSSKQGADAAKAAADAYDSYTKSVKSTQKEIAGINAQLKALEPTTSADRQAVKAADEAVKGWDGSVKNAKLSLETYYAGIKEGKSNLDDLNATLNASTASIVAQDSALGSDIKNIESWTAKVQDAKEAVDKDQKALDEAKAGLKPYEAAVESAKNQVHDAQVKVDDLTKALEPYQQAYDAATDAVKKQEQAIADFKLSIQPLQDAMDTANNKLQEQKLSVQDLSASYKDLTDQLKGYADMQIAEEQPLLQQINQLKMQEAQVELQQAQLVDTNGGVAPTATSGNFAAYSGLTSQLTKLKSQENVLQLQDTVQFDPVKAQIKKLQDAGQTQTMSSGDIIAGMSPISAAAQAMNPQLQAAQKSQAADQSSYDTSKLAYDQAATPMTEMNLGLAKLKDTQSAANDALKAAKEPLAAAKQSLSEYKQELSDANQKLSEQRQKVQEASEALSAAKRTEKDANTGLSGAKAQLNPDFAAGGKTLQDQLQAAKDKQTEDEKRVSDLKDQLAGVQEQLDDLKSHAVDKPGKNEGSGLDPNAQQGLSPELTTAIQVAMSGRGPNDAAWGPNYVATPLETAQAKVQTAIAGPLQNLTEGLDKVQNKINGLKDPAEAVGGFIKQWGSEIKIAAEALGGIVLFEKVAATIEALSKLRTVTWGIAAAKAAWALASDAVNGAELVGAAFIDDVKLAAYAAGTWAVAVGKGVWAAATWVLDAALGVMDFLMSPITLIVVGLALAIGGLIYVFTHWSDISQWISENVLPKLSQAVQFVKDRALQIWEWIKEHWPLLVGIFGGPIAAIAMLIYTHWEDIKGFFTAAWTFINEAWTTFITAFKEDWDKAWGWVGDRFSDFGTAINNAWTGITTAVSTVWDTWSGKFKGFWSGFWSGVVEDFKGIIKGVESFTITIFNSVLTIITSIVGKIREAISAVANSGIANAPGLGWIKDAANGLLQVLPQNFGQLTIGSDGKPSLTGFQGGSGGGDVGGSGNNSSVPDPVGGSAGDDSSVDSSAQSILERARAQLRQPWRDAAGDTLCEAFSEQMSGSLPRAGSAWSQWQNNPNGVAGSSLAGVRPGDALYFGPTGDNGNYGHTGIYEGNGMFISVTDAGVKEEPVSWWNQNSAPLLGYIPTYDNGGVVPGPVGKPTLAWVRGGEEYKGADASGPKTSGEASYSISVTNQRKEATADEIVYQVRQYEYSRGRRFVKR